MNTTRKMKGFDNCFTQIAVKYFFLINFFYSIKFKFHILLNIISVISNLQLNKSIVNNFTSIFNKIYKKKCKIKLKIKMQTKLLSKKKPENFVLLSRVIVRKNE